MKDRYEYDEELKYYMNLIYHMDVKHIGGEDGKQYLLEYTELPGCVACNKDFTEAMRSLDRKKRCFLESALKVKSYIIPEPPDFYTSHDYSSLVETNRIVRECKKAVLKNLKEEMFDDTRFKDDIFEMICFARCIGDLTEDDIFGLQKIFDEQTSEENDDTNNLIRRYCNRYPLMRYGLSSTNDLFNCSVIAEIFSSQIMMHDNVKEKYIILLQMRIVLLLHSHITGWDICRALCSMLPQKYIDEAMETHNDIFEKNPRLTREEVETFILAKQ